MNKLLSVTFVLIYFTCQSQVDSSLVIENLTSRFLKANSSDVSFIKSPDNYSGFFLYANERGDRVRVCSQKEVTIWIEGQLFEKVEGCRNYQKDSLFKVFGQDTLFVVFGGRNDLSYLQVEMLSTMDTGKEIMRPKYRSSNPKKDFVIVGLITFLFLILLIKKQIIEVLNRIKYLTKRNISQELSVQWSFLSINQIKIIVFLSLMVAFILMIHQLDTILVGANPIAFSAMVLNWLGLALLIVAACLIKYLLIYIVSVLFNKTSVREAQYLGFIDLFFVVSGMSTVLFMIDYWFFDGQLILNKINISNALTFAALTYVVIAYIRLSNEFASQKLHIISYLCTTEFIPAYIIAYRFLG